MLNPNNDRLNYGELVSPPNYRLNFAIGTTYSLDLNALIGLSLALRSSLEVDSNLSDNSIFLLDALRENSQKVALFCDNGQIHYPNNVTPLFILIEDMVFQVDPQGKSKNNHYFSFHPKFWLLRYIDDENNVLYRLIVLSRNLTFDKSWDVSLSMDGYIREDENPKNDAIISFIEYLTKFSKGDEKKTIKMQEIVKELKHIHFDLKRSIFDDYEFFVNGINNYEFSIKNDGLFNNLQIDKLLVMSPFISKKVIHDFNSNKNPNSKALLFTRLESLKKLDSDDCSKFEIYTLKNEVVYDELAVDGEVHEKRSDIHAKLYLVEGKRFTDLYLGSLNASTNALNGNVEFVVKLTTRRNNLNVKKLSEDLFAGKKDNPGNPFEEVDFDNLVFEKESEKKDLGSFVKDIVKLNPQALIKFNGRYTIELKFDDYDKDHFNGLDVKIKPLLAKVDGCSLSDKLIFENLAKLELSEFYSVHITDLSGGDSINKVIKVPTDGMPTDRQKDVLSEFISTEQDFINYVAFLLGDSYVLSSIQKINIKAHGSRGISGKNLTELYERMLKAAYGSPEKFKELKFLIDNLSDKNIIPKGFSDLYNTFMEVIE